MLEELRILLHLGFLVLVTANDRYRNPRKHEEVVPYFGPTPDNYTYEAGQLALLKCDVRNLGKKRIGWRRASQPNPLTIGDFLFVEDERIKVEHPPFSTEWNLMIKRVSIEDAGVYECQVASKARHLRKHVLLTVKEPKIKRTKNKPRAKGVKDVKGELYDIQITGEEFIEQGDMIYLRCNATGQDHSPDDLDWFKNGNKLTTEFARNTYIRKLVSLTTRTIVSVLEIKNAKLDDAGVYVCRTSDLQITSKRINVLKTGRENVKRGTHAKQDGSSGGRCYGNISVTLGLLLVSLFTNTCRHNVIMER